jgi:hypothetical protein
MMHNERPRLDSEAMGPPALKAPDTPQPAEIVPVLCPEARTVLPETTTPPRVVPPVIDVEAQMAGSSPLPHGLSKTRLGLAFAVASVSDLISVFTQATPPVEWGVDLATALVLFSILGFRWLLLPGLIMEAIPGVGVVPFWVLVVGAVAVYGRPRPQLS